MNLIWQQNVAYAAWYESVHFPLQLILERVNPMYCFPIVEKLAFVFFWGLSSSARGACVCILSPPSDLECCPLNQPPVCLIYWAFWTWWWVLGLVSLCYCLPQTYLSLRSSISVFFILITDLPLSLIFGITCVKCKFIVGSVTGKSESVWRSLLGQAVASPPQWDGKPWSREALQTLPSRSDSQCRGHYVTSAVSRPQSRYLEGETFDSYCLIFTF